MNQSNTECLCCLSRFLLLVFFTFITSSDIFFGTRRCHIHRITNHFQTQPWSRQNTDDFWNVQVIMSLYQYVTNVIIGPCVNVTLLSSLLSVPICNNYHHCYLCQSTITIIGPCAIMSKLFAMSLSVYANMSFALCYTIIFWQW